MASFEIQWKHSARKELKKLDRSIISKIIPAIESLIENPFPVGIKKLYGSEHTYRMRVGDYRIVYSVHGQILIVEIIGVGHRKEVYKKLIRKLSA